MFFRDPTKYKYTTENIIVGRAELHQVQVRYGQTGWATPGGGVITDRKQAVAYAKRMNQIIEQNTLRIKAQNPLRT